MDPSTLVALLGVTAVGAVVALVAVLSRKGRTEDRARAYLAGFTYVLSDDADAAIAELSRAAQLSTQTLETYLALGQLFRRKGDLDRAIRLHQNILLRPGLTPEIRRGAQLALALDYRRSGLKDKAQECFEKLLADDPQNREALVRYRQLHEEAGAWDRAAELQTRLLKLDGAGHGVLAHLLAAHARSSIQSAPEEALAVAKKAVELSPRSADAQLALAEVHVAAGNAGLAAAHLEQAVLLEPELARPAVPLLRAVLPPEAAEQLLRARMDASERDEPYALALALWLRDRGRVEDAIVLLRRLLERRPLLWEARKELGALLLAQDRSEEVRADYQQILGTLGHPALGFTCTSCRQKLPEHAFRCASCETWDTVRRDETPVVGERRTLGA